MLVFECNLKTSTMLGTRGISQIKQSILVISKRKLEAIQRKEYYLEK